MKINSLQISSISELDVDGGWFRPALFFHGCCRLSSFDRFQFHRLILDLSMLANQVTEATNFLLP